MAEAIKTRRGGNNLKGKLPEFTYSGGTYELIDDGKVDGVQNWRIKFFTSGTLTFTKNVGNIDVFLVGGGGSTATNYMWGGAGGGYTTTVKGIFVKKDVGYPIIVGAGGAAGENAGARGGTSSAFDCQAYGGDQPNGLKGGAGGSGGGGYSGGVGGTDGADGTSGGNGTNAGGKGQGTTTREFGESTGTLYSTGGYGLYTSGHKEVDASPNTGDGANGYHCDGGSGIVVIRNARE